MSHRGEGAIYRDSHDRPSPPGMTSKSTSRPADVAGMAQGSAASATPKESSEQAAPLTAQEGVCPDPSTLKAPVPPPPPPLPESDSSMQVPRMEGEQSQMTEKLDKAIDVRQLSAHDVVPHAAFAA